VACQAVLDLAGANPVAGARDDVVGAADDAEGAVLVELAEVTGADPPVDNFRRCGVLLFQ